MHRRAIVPTALIAAVLLVAGCGGGGDGGGTRGVFVGRVAGSDAFVAVISTGSEVAGYICDGRRTSQWLDASRLRDGRATLVDRRGRRVGSVTLNGDQASGSVALPRGSRRFAAAPAAGDAGLYRAAKGTRGEKGSVEVGWVVLADGAQRGGTNIVINDEEQIASSGAPQLKPGTTTVNVARVGTLSVNKLGDGSVRF